jgi:hypothetical protein
LQCRTARRSHPDKKSQVISQKISLLEKDNRLISLQIKVLEQHEFLLFKQDRKLI